MTQKLSDQKGYVLLSLMVLVALIPTFVLITMNYTDIIGKGSRIAKSSITRVRMMTVRNIIANNARDVDSDGYYEVWKEAAGNTLPTTITVNTKDEWDTPFRYCTYDLGNCNQSDATYTQNNPNSPCTGSPPPIAGLVMRLISAGKDKIFQTSCTSTTAQGDDVVFDETEMGIKSSAGENAPTGTIVSYAGDVIPSGWLPCDGRAVSRAAYSALFSVIGTKYGSGNGSTTFNLPNLQYVRSTPLPTPRTGHAASVLPDGRVLIAGGDEGPNTYIGTISGNTITWVESTSLPAPMWRHSASVLPDGRVLIAGGGGANYIGTISGNTITWVESTPLPTPRWGHTASVLPNGRILIAGGAGPGVYIATPLIGTISGNTITWVESTPLPIPRWFHAASVLPDGRVLIAGGFGNGTTLANTLIGTISGNTITWVESTPLPTPRVGHTASVLPDGRVLIAGGSVTLNTLIGTISGNTITWVESTSLPAQMWGHSASVLPDGRVLIAGGDDANNVSRAETYIYIFYVLYIIKT